MHAADIQDRDGGELVMATLFGLYPFLLRLYADGGYQGPLFRRAMAKIMAQVNVEIVKRSDHAKGFIVLPKRWVTGQGLGKSQPPRPRIPTSRVDQAHAEKAMQSNMIFPDRLLALDLSLRRR